MNEFDEHKDIDMAEIWRQNYQDAKDEIRNLKLQIKELETENAFLANDLERAESFILR